MSDARWSRDIAMARPRAVAALLRAFRDLDTAEDAFQEACVRALDTWPRQGPPKDPTAWLIFVGRNVGIDALRRHQRIEELPDEPWLPIDVESEARLVDTLDERPYGDEILRLFFVCCHPCLTARDQIALALRVVAGLTVEEIARAFLVKPKALEQRLTRAKRRLAAAEVRYGTPTAEERAGRLPAVTTMVLLLFNEGYAASGGEVHVRLPLCDEAIRLARLLLSTTPSDPETMGLLALCRLQHARHRARLDAAGELILLADQDRSAWDRDAIDEGLVLIEKALRRRRPGPLQIQAAIAATHAGAATAAATDWREIERLYAALERFQPTPVVRLNRAVAVFEADGAEAALALVDPLAETLGGYFHWHAVRGRLLAELGRPAEAATELRRARDLTRTPAEARHLDLQLDRLSVAGSASVVDSASVADSA